MEEPQNSAAPAEQEVLGEKIGILMSPNQGPVDGGTLVTIQSLNGGFDEQTSVLFGQNSGVEINVINAHVLTVVTPPGAEGTVPVYINVPLLAIPPYPNPRIRLPKFEYYIVPPDDGTDKDGDSLTNTEEETGWSVWIEGYGLQMGVDTFGNVLVQYPVTSDPLKADTDGDGLSDYEERLFKSDPRKVDSDEDGLWDGEEVHRWRTSPTSVDTDADSRGDRNLQNAPNPALFDGRELFDIDVLKLPPDSVNVLQPGVPQRIVKPRATSPTLADTDGDGVSDFDELNSTVRNAVLADLPRLEYELVGDVDVRLNVEYAETIGESHEYGTTLTRTQTDTVASSYSSTIGWSLEMGIEAGYAGASVHALYTVTAGLHGEYTWTSSTESSKEASEEKSRLDSDSREFTETAADGAIRTSILLKNPGNTTFTLNGLGVLVSQREMLKAPGDTSPTRLPKTIATMTPVFDAVTLAPGETAGPFELAATGVNAQAIKELLAAPDSLLLGTAAMNFTDGSGLDFDFVRQLTLAQTANVLIDFGDGAVRTYQVATNVDRNPDGSYAGITLRRVLEEMLELPYGDPNRGYTTRMDASGREQLDSLLGRTYREEPAGTSRDYWTRMVTNPDLVDVDFNAVVLHAGDSLALFFSRDDDNDGLSNTLEKAAGTDQITESPTGDADNDGLTDKFEVTDGWIAFEDPSNPDAPHPDGFEKRRVFSSPTAVDTDGDGLTDYQEWVWRTDPLDPDTDGDSLPDGRDPFPNRRAATIYVKADAAPAGNGRTWLTAVRTIQEARTLYYQGLNSPDPSDDVAQIWVARGDYKPSNRSSPIALAINLGIYGGFSGPTTGFTGETKRGQRNTNAFTNGCVLTGDLSGNDTGVIDLNMPGTYAENCPVVVSAAADVDASALLDGFMITGAYLQAADADGAALFLLGSPTIQNCLITRNGNQKGGAGVRAGGASSAVFKKCIVAGNVAVRGGGAYLASSGRIIFEDCEFSQNVATRLGSNDDWTASGGGAYISTNVGGVDFNRCVFTGNSAWCLGGGLYATGNSLYLRVNSCRFYSNAVTTTGWWGDWRGCGGGIAVDTNASISNSVFWDNRSKQIGGAIAVISGAGVPNANGWWNGPIRRCTITNCTIASNRAWVAGGNSSGGGVATAGNKSNVLIQNTIAWANWYGVEPLPDDPNYEEHYQIYDWDGQSTWTVGNTCFNAGWPYRWRGVNGNINDDPSFRNLALGDLRLSEGSPCIDRGSTFVDLDPLLPGFQKLPDLDLAGQPRIVDGNNDGIMSVDIGAFEAQPTKR